jgi:hypothetical protein
MNIADMMKQAKAMQAKMQEMQQKLAGEIVVGESGSGKVKISMTGTYNVISTSIEPSLLGDAEMLEDLITAACNDARQKVEQMITTETQQIMGGMNLPAGF